jgi:hypothetical protein
LHITNFDLKKNTRICFDFLRWQTVVLGVNSLGLFVSLCRALPIFFIGCRFRFLQFVYFFGRFARVLFEP